MSSSRHTDRPSTDHLRATCIGWTQAGQRGLLTIQDRSGKTPRYLAIDLPDAEGAEIHIELDRPRACGLGLVELVEWTGMGMHIRLAPEAEQLGWAANIWVHASRDDVLGENTLRSAAWFFEGFVTSRSLRAGHRWLRAA